MAHLQAHLIIHAFSTSIGLPVTWAPLKNSNLESRQNSREAQPRGFDLAHLLHGSLFPAETNERQLPRQRVPQPSSNHHHEGAPGGQDRLCLLPGRTVGIIRFYGLLFIQVCHQGIGWSLADGGKCCVQFLYFYLLTQQCVFPFSLWPLYTCCCSELDICRLDISERESAQPLHFAVNIFHCIKIMIEAKWVWGVLLA